jgi:sigma-B regulation protein RsbU (phosphoserine phosphatase)
MKIRTKLLWLTLGVSLVPMMLIAGLHRYAMFIIEGEVSAIAYDSLVDDATHYLQAQVDNYGQIVKRDAVALRFALQIQADAAEKLLATRKPPSPKNLFFVEDFDREDPRIKNMRPSMEHWRFGPDGKKVPIRISYETPVIFTVEGTDRKSKAVREDIARLGPLQETFKSLREIEAGMFFWQYISLGSGVHYCLPGKGGYPGDFDPRKREWYTRAIAENGEYWMLNLDATSKHVTLTVSMPVRRPDGAIAGVTAIDVDVSKILHLLRLPENWAQAAHTMLVMEDDRPDSPYAGETVIIMQKKYTERGRHWDKTIDYEPFETDDPTEIAAIMNDIRAHRSGVRRIKYKGVDSLCAYGAREKNQAMPIVIVPYDLVIADGARATETIKKRTTQALVITGAIVTVVVVLVIGVVAWRSRVFSRPILQLAKAGEDLAGGDYHSHVDLHTGDELQDLGEVFNTIGPQLQEREKMKRSLALAMEVQQNLLPHESPKLAGFDIAGLSVYCDETGGDYYDFIELMDVGEEKVGLALGDITGHGIGAALLMASARGVLRSHAIGYTGDLGKLFADINGHLVRDTGDDRFLTLFYGVVEGPGGGLSYASGGHDPAAWWHAASRSFEELPNTGMMLGAFPEAEYQQAGPFELKSGDIVAIGTDGIWEAMNTDNEMFDKQRYYDIVAKHADRPAEEICRAVVRAVRDFSGEAPQEDDITLIVIKKL